jgi:hypothetical protein
MEEDTESSTSIDENTENLDDENPTRFLLSEGLLRFFQPIILNLEETVRKTQLSQAELSAQIDIVSAVIKTELSKTNSQDSAYIEAQTKKLNNIKNRITVISNILQTSQERLLNLHQKIKYSEELQQSQ